jgi:DNA-directed RNA polymerase specialized sigma24 family protein
MDNLLLPYLKASDQSERQHHLDDLLIVYTAPVVRRTLRQRLGFHVNQLGVNPYNPDAEDLYHEIIAKVIEVLTALPTSPGTEIEDFEKYVGRISINACLDYIRSRSPARTRLKYSLREALSRKSEFALWKSEEGFLCGLRAGAKKQAPISFQRLTEIESDLPIFRTTRFGREDITRVPLTKLTAELLKWIDEPIELDELVNLTAILLDVRDRPAESIDDEAKTYLEARIADTTLVSDPGLDSEKLLRHLWRAVLALPKNQRDAFCLLFETENGEDLFTLLFQANLTTPSQLAQDLGRSLQELVRVWAAMPMDYAAIAIELKATLLQVRKSRFDALRRLEKEDNLRRFLGQK